MQESISNEISKIESELASHSTIPVERNDVSDKYEVVLPYKPFASTEKWLAHRFSAWSAPKTWFATTLVVTFFGFGGPGKVIEWITQLMIGNLSGAMTTSAGTGAALVSSNIMIVMWMSFAIIITALVMMYIYLRHPTHVVLNQNGIALVWKRRSEWYRKSLNWKDLQRINIVWPPNKTSPQDSLLSFTPINGDPLQFKYGALPSIDSRQSLMDSIDRWAPHASRAPELVEMLSKPHTHGYTELWLQALSQPPKRERLTPLLEGAMLRSAQYEIVGRLGVGGQGTAYAAREVDNNDAVVLKEFILPVYVDVNVRRQSVEKMQNEAEILSKLNHNRIVKLIDFFIEDHRGYLVLERIDGHSLRQKVSESGRLTETEVRSLALQMCEMLEYLHGLEPPVVHRDFTPDNLILSKDGVLKLVDFNVAQQQESTSTCTVVGKHCFISPEQFRGKPTSQSDIYSMGATLYYLLTGEDPEPITCSHPKQRVEGLSDSIDELVAKTTALTVQKRYAKASEIRADLENA
ncbi:MAG TPA: serine/threonine protein kinase [Candidatus Melainabacteria bacterium]|nr:serine/threonine protein kinase [Candidatus Melainabacteria bacterium]HIN66803.1 serine/threonine protein kinase [Candidatus Obscuribacterales bacterium]